MEGKGNEERDSPHWKRLRQKQNSCSSSSSSSIRSQVSQLVDEHEFTQDSMPSPTPSSHWMTTRSAAVHPPPPSPPPTPNALPSPFISKDIKPYCDINDPFSGIINVFMCLCVYVFMCLCVYERRNVFLMCIDPFHDCMCVYVCVCVCMCVYVRSCIELVQTKVCKEEYSQSFDFEVIILRGWEMSNKKSRF